MVRNDVLSGLVIQSLSSLMNLTSRNFMLRGESFRRGLILIIEEIIHLYQITNGLLSDKTLPNVQNGGRCSNVLFPREYELWG